MNQFEDTGIDVMVTFTLLLVTMLTNGHSVQSRRGSLAIPANFSVLFTEICTS